MALFVSKTVPGVDTIEPVQACVVLGTSGVWETILPALGAGKKIILTDLIVASTLAASVRVRFRNGSASLTAVAVPAGGTVAVALTTPLVLSENAALSAEINATGTSVFVTAVGFVVNA